MIEWVWRIFFFLNGMILLLTLLGIVSAVTMPGIDRWSKSFFITFFSLIFLCIVIYLIDWLLDGNPRFVTLETIVVYFEFLSNSLLMPMPAVFLLHHCGENRRSSFLFRAVLALWCVFFILLCINNFNTLFYYNTPDNQFFRGPLFALLLAPLAVLLIITLIGVLRRRNVLSKRYFTAFLIYLLPITAAMIAHIFISVLFSIYIAVSFCAFAMYNIVILEQIEVYMDQQREIANQRSSVMVLQMRPHFIYNTMMSIYYLCEQDAKKAQQVTLDFTTYLRKNFTAIASENTIPFTEELAHTRAYLAVEQAQFEDSLFVDYDTTYTQFHIPPLTLQPIVENAVKHGMDPDGEPLHISIRSRQTNSGSEIIVENTGADFEPADNNEPHIALSNIEHRLKLMCNGELAIKPREGGGTVVTVTIPG